MENLGWIKLHRKLYESSLWKNEKFTRGQAWADLLLMANFANSDYRIRGIKVYVQRGQIARSVDYFSNRWKWSKGKIKRFFNELETDHQIEIQKTNIISILTIINYEQYQGNEPTNELPNSTPNEPANSTPNRPANGPYNKNDKKEKNVKNDKNNNKTKFSDEILEVTQFLYDCIMRFVNPSAYKNRPPNLDKWASSIDKLHRLDKAPIKDIKRVILFATQDNFWSQNILSGDKLRKHYVNLELKSRNKTKASMQNTFDMIDEICGEKQ